MTTLDRETLIAKLRNLNPWRDMDWPETVNAAADALSALPPQSVEVTEEMVELSARCRRLAYPANPPIFIEIADALDAVIKATRPSGDGIRAGRAEVIDIATIEATARKINPGRSEDHIKSVALDALSIYRALNGGKNG